MDASCALGECPSGSLRPERCKLMEYDLERKRVESVKEISGPQCDLSLIYVRSLLGVGGGDENNSEKKAGENAEKSKKQKQQPSRKKK
ncbi:hypothetical protein PanWU01x14_293160 [Parasponia andersonii]|uniref:Uncharacterized protein n=1 Tax=Parasponia andersonii TaxID=3476 RepID=A0A2P5AWV3_PARAD|nr:hypothetical protein PanWU01x14_293160 [Parasponia andersonii]